MSQKCSFETNGDLLVINVVKHLACKILILFHHNEMWPFQKLSSFNLLLSFQSLLLPHGIYGF